MMVKISPEALINFWLAYKTSELPERGIRFGQAFCNEYNVTDPEIFYCKDSKKARRLIVEKYIDQRDVHGLRIFY